MKQNIKNKGSSKSKVNNELTTEELDILIEIFNDKDWEIESNLFEDFCSTLKLLDKRQRKLVLELTKDFKCIDVGKYYHHFVSSFDRYIESLRAEKQGRINVYIIPMIAPTDFGSIKSSTLLYYLIKSNCSELNGRYNKNGLARLSICLVDTVDYSKINQKYIEKMILPDSKVCLIDDFIGSGETAVSAANYLVEKHNVVKEKISIISIVSMKQGKDELESNNYKSYSDIICDKAISGTGYREEERKELMISISEKIKAKEICYLGFNQSEALIKMERTPNNTFPIYWLKNKTSKTPPFPR